MIVLFDSACAMCSASVRFLARLDTGRQLRFAGLGDPAARRLLGSMPRPDSMVVIDGAATYVESDAVVAIARALGFPAAILRAIPKAWRDALYRFIARNRHRFQRPRLCRVDDRVRERYLHE